MNARILILGIVVTCLAATAAYALADDVTLGTWKSNPAKSDFGLTPPSPKLMKVEVMDSNIHITVDGTDEAGLKSHTEYLGKYDGKDYPVKGDPQLETLAYTKIDDYTFEVVGKRNGRVTVTSKVVYSRDGKTRTAVQTAQGFGNKVTYTVIWDKQ